MIRRGDKMVFLGIDGGGTKTTCLVTDENLTEKYRTVGSSINFYSEGMEKARENMKSMLRVIEEGTGISRFDGVCIGSSALFGRADEKTKNDFCDGVFNSDRIIMDSDLFIALKAVGEENAMVVIAGTGSMAAGFGKNKEVITKGGYGYILGDEGSGYSIASEGIKAAVRSLDGTGTYTVLGEKLLEFAGVKSKEELVDVFYGEGMDRKAIAAFSECVSEAEREDDDVASSIIFYEAKLLSETASALLREMPGNPHIALFGGVFQHCEVFTSHFRIHLSEKYASCSLMTREPVFGACIAAREMCL